MHAGSSYKSRVHRVIRRKVTGLIDGAEHQIHPSRILGAICLSFLIALTVCFEGIWYLFYSGLRLISLVPLEGTPCFAMPA